MEKERLDEFHQQLCQLRTEMLSRHEVSREAAGTVTLDQTSVGRLSRMDALQSQQMAIEVQRRKEQLLTRIEGALRRIDKGEFGECFECGDDISLARLQVDPTVTRCIRCQK